MAYWPESQPIGASLPALRVAVRSGDTPARDRAAMVRKPPDIMITTPESLHLMLTSRARETLRGISHVIVDEIHAVCGNKRGVFLALLLERLQAIAPGDFVRIGLSATQRPLEEVARYLGGLEGPARRIRRSRGGSTGDYRRRRLASRPRPASIWPRRLDSARRSRGPIWPDIERELIVPGRRPSLDDHLRQQSADGREADRPTQRAGWARELDQKSSSAAADEPE